MKISIKEFHFMIDRLRENKWCEYCPTITSWIYYKRHFRVMLNWYTGEITFTNLLRKDDLS